MLCSVVYGTRCYSYLNLFCFAFATTQKKIPGTGDGMKGGSLACFSFSTGLLVGSLAFTSYRFSSTVVYMMMVMTIARFIIPNSGNVVFNFHLEETFN